MPSRRLIRFCPVDPAANAAARGHHRRLAPARDRMPAAAVGPGQLAARHRPRAPGRPGPRRAGGWAARRRGGVEGLIHEYALSSQEGVALMCLAEALLRIPDDATRDALIRDKIGGGDWRAHLGHSPSLFVNAATWGLLLTGRLTATSSERSLSAALTRLIARGGEPLIRTGVDLAMRLMGEQFVAGQTIDEALANGRALEEQGFRYSYDMLGEAAVTDAATPSYLRRLRAGDPRHRPRRRGPRHLRRPGHLGQALGAASALQPRAARARAGRALSAPEGIGRAGAAPRHRPQHRCRGGRPAGDLARPAGAALLRARAGRLERHRLRRPGLPEARALRDRLADRPRAPQPASADGAAGQGRLLGQRDQARAGRRAGRTSRSSRARHPHRRLLPRLRAQAAGRARRAFIRSSPPTTR